MRPFLSDLREFGKHNHFNVVHPVLRSVVKRIDLFRHLLTVYERLLALGLELPEETFVNMYNYDAPGETSSTFRNELHVVVQIS